MAAPRWSTGGDGTTPRSHRSAKPSRGRTPCLLSTATCRWNWWWRRPSPRRWSSLSARRRWSCRCTRTSVASASRPPCSWRSRCGHPRSGMSALNDTNNAMMKKIGHLRTCRSTGMSYNKDQLEKVIDIIFSVTQGKGKARMRKDTSLEMSPPRPCSWSRAITVSAIRCTQ